MYYFLTDRTKKGDKVVFNYDNGLDQDLINYCNDLCKKECGHNFDPDCGDCHVTRLYYAVSQLAEYEDIRLTPDEVKELKEQQNNQQPRKAHIVNYEQLPSGGKITSDGQAVKECSCQGRCYIFYDEDRRYRVECENCGTIVIFVANSMDEAINLWNNFNAMQDFCKERGF